MSVTDEIKQLEVLGDVKVKGNLSIEDIVRRQIDRCNMTISAADSEVFNANVRALMKHLPGTKYDEIMGRTKEYNSTHERYEYRDCCGNDVGTPENPFIIVAGHDEWNFLNEVPRPFREKNEEAVEKGDVNKITIVSPIRYEETTTDYEKLYRIVLEAFEERGLTWNVISKTAEMGRVKDRYGDERTHAPKKLVKIIEKAIVQILTDERMKDSNLNDVTFNEIVEDLRYLAPPTPVMGSDT